MEINAKDLSPNVIRKIAILIIKASELGMDVSGYGHADENKSSGYTYLWLEDYPFTLFIRPCGDDEIGAVWSNPENGEESEIDVKGKTLAELNQWVDNLYNELEA